jgi:hypothetical protein
MNKSRVIAFASVIAAAMVFGGVLGATAFAGTALTSANAALTAASPSPSFHSNETPSHESGESAAQEQAENNGTFRPGGPGAGGHPCGGHSNEDATHEKGETAAQEAAENAACPSPAASPTASK